MHPARITELLEPFLATRSRACHSEERSDEEPDVLSSAQLSCISTYIDILLRWNARINLTAVRDPEAIVTRHFGESFFLARHLFPAPATVERTPGSPENAALASQTANHQPLTAVF